MKSNPDATAKLVHLLQIINTDEWQTAAEIAQHLGVSVRMIYNYLPVLINHGFKVEKRGTRYRLDCHSEFFERMKNGIPLTSHEAEFVCRMLSVVVDNNNIAQSAKRKLVRYYDLDDYGSIRTDKSEMMKYQQLNEAITKKRIVMLKNYSSPHSRSVKDRLVEPYYIFNSGRDVRCYEVASKMNKTFKISRIGNVEVTEAQWTNEKKHRRIYTDIFQFSGEDVYCVELILGQLSRNLLVEEYPQVARFVKETGDGRWRVILNVTSYVGVGRFVLGLYDDIEIVGDEDFKTYLREKIASWAKQER